MPKTIREVLENCMEYGAKTGVVDYITLNQAFKEIKWIVLGCLDKKQSTLNKDKDLKFWAMGWNAYREEMKKKIKEL